MVCVSQWIAKPTVCCLLRLIRWWWIIWLVNKLAIVWVPNQTPNYFQFQNECLSCTWNNLNHCAYFVLSVNSPLCLSWSVLQLTRSCHVCFNLSRLCSGSLSRQRCTLAVASTAILACMWNVNLCDTMLSFKTYLELMVYDYKQTSKHTHACIMQSC